MVKLDHPVFPLLGRLLMVYIFATSGLAKVLDWSGNVQYMGTRHLPMIPLLLAIAAAVELGGSLALVTGYQARLAAFILAIYTIVLTLIFHAYWSAPASLAGMQETHFRKNLAIAGGLLVLAWCGPGRWALGNRERVPTGPRPQG